MVKSMPHKLRHAAAVLMLLLVGALVVAIFVEEPTHASASVANTGATSKLEPCSIEEWQTDITGCVDRLTVDVSNRAQCLEAPTPDAPDSGFAGWFATQPESAKSSGASGLYSQYGYAGYSYTTYDIGCLPIAMHPDYKFENTIANGEFMLATGVIGASNALRERAWNPSEMWGWADPLVEKATKSLYSQVFTVFGAVTLCVVGMYLIWRSRQAEMSAAITTAGWAILVMVVVSALAAWPVLSARVADQALVTSLGVIHEAVGPPSKELPPDQCPFADKDACADHRAPAVRASDTIVESTLYRNWLRGLLGSADSLTAQKYGRALYRAKVFTWGELEDARIDPTQRQTIVARKHDQWLKVAEQVRIEDPEAYDHLTGRRGMERIGAGFISLLSALLFVIFDLTSSILVLVGFLVFRWAVIAAPLIGTIGLLKPASAGLRRLLNSVVAALTNIVVFGAGAAIYLFAVDVIVGTRSLPGWLQILLIWLCGIVGWQVLRPYRRVLQMGGRAATERNSAMPWLRGFRTSPDSTPNTTQQIAHSTQQRTESLSEYHIISQQKVPPAARRGDGQQSVVSSPYQTSAPDTKGSEGLPATLYHAPPRGA